MKRPLVCLALACCAHRAPPATPPETSSPVTCEAGGLKVVLSIGAKGATLYEGGVRIGASDCAVTAQAIYSIVCQHDPSFEFLYASIPGPPILGGKSARLRTGDGIVFLDCQPGLGVPASSEGPATPAGQYRPNGVCLPPATACGRGCCDAGEECCNAGPGPVCVRGGTCGFVPVQ